MAAVGLVLVTSLVFDHFDPARQGVPALRIKRKAQPAAEEIDSPRLSVAALAPLAAQPVRPSLFTLLRAELALLVHGRSRWLTAVVVVATLLSAAAPPGDGPPVGALVWVWPVLLWSELGTRTQAYRTRTLVYAAPEPRRAQF